MANDTKRRSVTRKKKRASAPLPKQVGRTWTNEALAVFFFALAIFLLSSVISFEIGKVSGIADRSRNLMGPVGHLVATLLSGSIGWSSLVFVAWASWLSLYFWRCDDEEPLIKVQSKWGIALGVVLMVTSTSTLLALTWFPRAGGGIGGFTARPVSMLFGEVGGALASVALLLVALALTTQQSVITVLRGIGVFLARVVVFLGVVVPHLLYLTTKTLLHVVGHATGTLFTALAHLLVGSRRELFPANDEEEINSLPVPQSRRVRRLLSSRDASSSEGDEDEDTDEARDEEGEIEEGKDDHTDLSDEDGASDDAGDEDYEEPESDEEIDRRIVVERRGSAKRVSAREIRKAIREVAERSEDEIFASYKAPELSLLTRGEATPGNEDDAELKARSLLIESKLSDFGILGKVTHIHPGPVITLFEFEPAPGVKVGKIAALQDDLAMSLRASSIRIIAPIPKRGTVGIEVPNRQRDLVRLRDCLESEAFIHADSILSVPIGKDTYGDPVVVDIATMPHLLMAGSTGTGKSVCINAVLLSLLYRASPAELGLILIDPKILELSIYENIPHLRVPVVTVPRQAKAVLEWAVNEMNRRYRMMQKYGVRNIDSYNKIVQGADAEPGSEPGAAEDAAERAKSRLADNIVVLREDEVVEGGVVDAEPAVSSDESAQIAAEKLKPLPKIVIVIDELADLMLSVGRDIEELVTRLAQKARAAGIHLIVATQRPSVDVITGLIKANFPARLSFRVSSRIDSRTILDCMGAERLLGRGDMLLMQPGADAPLRRVHGAFVSDSEVKKVVDAIKATCGPHYDDRIMAICEKALEEERQESSRGNGNSEESEYDEMYDKCVELVMDKGQASTSMLQRAFRIGYNRAARIVDMMEREGLVGPMDGAKPREVIAPAPALRQSPSGSTSSPIEPPREEMITKDRF